MIRNAVPQHFGEMFADELLLFERELKRIRAGQVTRDFGGEHFRGFAARRKDQHGTEVFCERLGNEARPVAANFTRQVPVQIVRLHLFQRHGANVVTDQFRHATETLKPFHDVLRIGDAAAEEEQLRLRRREGEGEFVVQPAILVADHLIFVHDQQRGAVAANESVLLRLQCGDKDGRFEIFREITGGDADVPAARAPFGELVIGEGARGHGVNRLAAIFPLVRPQLEDERLAGAGGRLHHHVAPVAQGRDRLLLPEVGHGDLVQRGNIFKWLG